MGNDHYISQRVDHFCHQDPQVTCIIHQILFLPATLRGRSNHPHLTRKNLRLREGKASAEEMGEPSPPIHALEMSSAKSPYDCAHITVLLWASDFHLKNRTPSSLQVWGKAKLKQRLTNGPCPKCLTGEEEQRVKVHVLNSVTP